MKLSFTCLLLTFFYFIPSFSEANSSKQTAFVQSLINKANPGDTVVINSGIYSIDSLTITKPLHLRGIKMPVFDGNNKGTILIVRARNVSIEGIHLKNSGSSGYNDYAAVAVENSVNVTIQNCIIENSFFGIYYSGTTSGSILNNKIISNKIGESASGNGIHLWKCDKINISNNNIVGHRDGIYLEFSTNSNVIKNYSENNIRYGLHFMFSHNNKYFENTFKNNGAGVAVMYTKNVEMRNNIFIDNQGTSSFGILLKDISDSKIFGNTFENNTCAINMEECNRIEVFNNNFIRNGWAIRIQASCSGNIIENNNFIGNTFDITTNGTIVMNTFDGNYWDHYSGYDLNRDNIGDVPYLPVSLYSIIVDQLPIAMVLYRSFMVTLLVQMEKIMPSITPEALIDNRPIMKPIKL